MVNLKWAHFSITGFEHLKVSLQKESCQRSPISGKMEKASMKIIGKASNRSIVSTFPPSKHFNNLRGAIQMTGIILAFSFFLPPSAKWRVQKPRGQLPRRHNMHGTDLYWNCPVFTWISNVPGNSVSLPAEIIAWNLAPATLLMLNRYYRIRDTCYSHKNWVIAEPGETQAQLTFHANRDPRLAFSLHRRHY